MVPTDGGRRTTPGYILEKLPPIEQSKQGSSNYPFQRSESGIRIGKGGFDKIFFSAQVYGAWTGLHVIQNAAKEVRRSFFENKYQEVKEQSDKLKAAFIQAINDAEYMNLLWPRFHKYGINQIDIPVYDDQGEISEFRSVTEPSEMFSHIIWRNSDHFSQAKSAPFVEGFFGQELPPFQQNDFSESILKGTINLENYDVNEAIKALYI